VGIPVALVLSPIVVPTLLIRRAIYGPMKCGGKCKSTTGNVASEEKVADDESKDAELPKADRT